MRYRPNAPNLSSIPVEHLDIAYHFFALATYIKSPLRFLYFQETDPTKVSLTCVVFNGHVYQRDTLPLAYILNLILQGVPSIVNANDHYSTLLPNVYKSLPIMWASLLKQVIKVYPILQPHRDLTLTDAIQAFVEEFPQETLLIPGLHPPKREPPPVAYPVSTDRAHRPPP